CGQPADSPVPIAGTGYDPAPVAGTPASPVHGWATGQPPAPRSGDNPGPAGSPESHIGRGHADTWAQLWKPAASSPGSLRLPAQPHPGLDSRRNHSAEESQALAKAPARRIRYPQESTRMDKGQRQRDLTRMLGAQARMRGQEILANVEEHSLRIERLHFVVVPHTGTNAVDGDETMSRKVPGPVVLPLFIHMCSSALIGDCRRKQDCRSESGQKANEIRRGLSGQMLPHLHGQDEIKAAIQRTRTA